MTQIRAWRNESEQSTVVSLKELTKLRRRERVLEEALKECGLAAEKCPSDGLAEEIHMIVNEALCGERLPLFNARN